MLKAVDLTGITFGSLVAVRFDEERHTTDIERYRVGDIDRVRRYYICRCNLCGRELSVRAENLKSGNTTGCGCDANDKGAAKRHSQHLNRFEYDSELDCYVGFANNTGNQFWVDKDTIRLIQDKCWYETNYGYMMTRVSNKKQIALHRLVILGYDNIDDDVVVDHINRNRLDCRLSNLRICTPADNSRNRSVRRDSSSGIRGVRYEASTGKWSAYIVENGKWHGLGSYARIDDAIKARNSAERLYFGAFS